MKQVFAVPPAGSGPLWMLVGLAVLFGGLLAMFGYMAWSSRHMTVEVSGTNLRIRRDLYGRSIPLLALALADARVVDLTREVALQPVGKRNGTVMPGYSSGWFRLRNGEKSLVFVTDRRRVLYLPTAQDYSLLISVQHPDSLLAALRRTGR
jgi:hypothetical protein